ncbi:glycosyltransferase family 39 protein [Candidatus Pacearchaeota archaeon]|nr:glycosyltransferase family 39 protein [Candidatus Pacearchaeota archaeon]
MNQPLWWDGADYMSAAKRLGLGLDIQDIWYYRRGFLFPLISAPFFMFGLSEIGVRFLEVLFSTGFVFVSYLFLTRLVDKKVALLVSICLSFSWLLLFFSGRILTDIPAAFLIILSFLFFWDGYYLKKGNKFLYLSAIIFVMAVLTRMQSFMIAPAFLMLAILKEKYKFILNKKLWIALFIFLVLMIPQFYLYSSHYGNPFSDITSYYLGIGEKAVETGNERVFSSAVFNYILNIPYILGDWVYYFFFIGFVLFFFDLILGFDKIFKNEELQKKFFIFFFPACIFLIMGYVGSVSYVEQRYVTAALPFLFLIIVYPLVKFGEILEKKHNLNKKTSNIIIVGILLLLLIPNFNLANNMIEEKKTSYLEVKQAGLWIKENSNPDEIIISASVPQTIYYSERSTYPFDPGFYYGTKLGNPDFLKYSNDYEGFLKFAEDYKPRFMILSIFESTPDWAQILPQTNPELLIPIKVYNQGEQSVLIIYEFKY